MRHLIVEITDFYIIFLLPYVKYYFLNWLSVPKFCILLLSPLRQENVNIISNFHWARKWKLNSLMSFSSYTLYVLLSPQDWVVCESRKRTVVRILVPTLSLAYCVSFQNYLTSLDLSVLIWGEGHTVSFLLAVKFWAS